MGENLIKSVAGKKFFQIRSFHPLHYIVEEATFQAHIERHTEVIENNRRRYFLR